MEEFLTKLYSYEYFGTYLIVAIIILIVLFIVILFFGKKDQKNREIEATKKLMQVNDEGANDQFVLDENIDNKQKELQDENIIVPNINELNENAPVDNNDIPTPILPVGNENKEVLPEVDETPLVSVETNAFKEEETKEPVEVVEEPVLPPVEEKPFVFEGFNNESINPVEETSNNEEEVKPVEISVPEFNFDEIVKNTEEAEKVEVEKPKPTEIFSSVYVPEQKKEIEESKKEEEEFELPTLKNEFKETNPKEDLEVSKLNDYNLDDISGESYDIK